MITVDDAAIRQLLSDVGDDVLSLYLEVDPSDPNNQRSSGREAWRIWLKNALRDLEEDVGDERDAKDRWRRTTAEVERFVSTYQPGGRTLHSGKRSVRIRRHRASVNETKVCPPGRGIDARPARVARWCRLGSIPSRTSPQAASGPFLDATRPRDRASRDTKATDRIGRG